MAQPLQDTKICIDPGHGGLEDDDRFIPQTGFWESVSNLDKAFYVRDMLEALGATVVLTRDGNDGVVDDPSLSQRVAIANSNNVDFMHSIHSNGWNGERNYTLMLFQGFDNNPTYPEAMAMGAIMAPELYRAHRTTSWSNRGDFDFYGTGQPYLGIFRNLNMPGTLSEGSFHDYIPESWRLMNTDYRKHEAHAITRAFLQYFNAEAPNTGVLAGILRDTERTVPYFYITPADAHVPINNINVILKNQAKSYTGDNLNNGFFLFDSLVPGSYEVVFDTPGYFKDSTTVNVIAGKTVFADANLIPDGTLLPPPAIPPYIRVMQKDHQSLVVECDSVAFAEHYVVYFSSDGTSFTDSIRSVEPLIEISGLTENKPVFIKLKATNASGSSPFARHIYAGAPSDSNEKVLVVNGFDRSSNSRFDYIRFYAGPITDYEYGFSYTMNESVIENKVTLDAYDIVIWILGDESTADHTFTPTEQDLVREYLKLGGNIFVSGAEIGWDLVAKGTTSDRLFYRNYLKASYISDAPLNQDGVHYNCESITGSIFEGLAEFSFDNGTHGTFDVDWPDAIRGIDGAQEILKYKNVAISNGGAGVVYEGMFSGGSEPGKLVYMSVPFETVYPETPRNNIMEKVFLFFDGFLSDVQMADELNGVTREFELAQNYPNPFNPETTIKFFLQQGGYTTLKIFNTLGQLVRVLVNDDISVGQHEVSFNASNLASGTYLYVLESGGQRIQRKMILLK
jgi:N-acetylmuramoyl-L-alanine amidase